MKKVWVSIVFGIVLLGLAVVIPCLRAGETGSATNYQVLAPIRHGNLTIFPVVSTRSHDTGQFLTLDEGLRSGEVIVTEAGNVSPLVRPRHPHPNWQEIRPGGGAEVNRLVLVNNSKKPLLLLAGEIVTGGKQDRIIGKDRLVPAESDPIDLGVFCVEPGRWVASSEHFGASESTYASRVVPGGVGGSAGGTIHGGPAPLPSTMMVQPSVRAKAMGDKDQNEVWAEVRKQQQAMQTVEVTAAAPTVATEIARTSSYAKVMENDDVK